MAKGLLIDTAFCSGCKSCEVACRNAHEDTINGDQYGIQVLELGPWKLTDEPKYEWTYVPVPTSLCDLCAKRVEEGRDPSCVHHCLCLCMEYGEAEELIAKADELGRSAVLYLVK